MLHSVKITEIYSYIFFTKVSWKQLFTKEDPYFHEFFDGESEILVFLHYVLAILSNKT